MTNCPRCGTALKDEYGMSQCPGCGAFSFIDMDGIAVIQDEARDVTQEHVPHPGGAAAPSDFNDPIEGLIEVNQVDDFQTFDPFPSMHSTDIPANADTNASQEFASAEFESIDMAPGRRSEQESEDASSMNLAPDAEQRVPQAFGPANDPLNLNDFANSEVSSAKDGPLLFRVLISGIDTKEIRESIREVLEDPRFAWDSNEIFSKVSKGHLAINDLSPVKASILVTRIKRLPVRVRWEQYAITQGQA
jgi:hypothetical protein